MSHWKISLFLILCSYVLVSYSNTDEHEVDQDSQAPSKIESITVVASRTDRDPDNVPATVSIISEEQMAQELSANIADLVRYEPNVSVGGTGSRWGLNGFTIRGIGGNRVLVVMDGVRIPDEFSFGPFLDSRRDYVDIDSLSKVEIMRGPVSVLHGSDALGGIVSYTSKPLTKRMRADQPWFLESKLRFDSSSGSNLFGVGAGFRTDNVAGGLFFNSEQSNEQESGGSSNSHGPQREQADPRDASIGSVIAKLSVFDGVSHMAQLTLESHKHSVDSRILSDYGSSFFGTTIHSRDAKDERDRNRVSLVYTGQFEDLFIDSLEVNVYQQSSNTEQLTLEQRESRGLRMNRTRRSVFEQEIVGFLVQVDRLIDLEDTMHHLILGVDQQGIDSAQLRFGSTSLLNGTPVREFFPYPTRDFPLSTNTHRALFVQNEMTLPGERWSISVGVRQHSYEVDGTADDIYRSGNPGQPPPTDLSDSKTTTKLGSVFRLNDEFSLYGSLAQGFRAPPYSSVNVGFTNPIGGYKTISNPNLESETSNGLELGVRYISDGASVRFAAFHSTFSDFIEDLALAPEFLRTGGVDPIDGFLTFQSINLTKVQTSGWEISGDLNLFDGPGFNTSGRFAFGTAQGENDVTHEPLNSIDPAKFVAGITGRGAKWQSSLILTHVTDKRAEDIAQDTLPPIDGHTVIDMTAEYRIQPNVVVNVGIFNLTSETYIRWSDAASIGSDAPLRFSQPEMHGLVSIRLAL